MTSSHEMHGPITMTGLVCLTLAILWSSSGWALDCAKASTPVERAICSDTGLKAADAHLSDLYFSVLNRAKLLAEITGDKAAHARLIDAQRGFVGTREKDCAAGGPADIKSCIARETAARTADLDQLSRHGPAVSDDALAMRDYKIGGGTITVAAGIEKSMRYRGTELLAGQDFYARDIWKGADVTALLVETYAGGTDQCRNVDIVETRGPGVVKAAHLDQGCAYGPRWEVQRTATGFSFETRAEPLVDGSVVDWSAATGAVSTRPTKFAPEPGLTMEGLLQLANPQYREPLRTAEFYDAIRALPDPDKTRAIQALWNISDTCDCNSEDRLNLYGAQIEQDLVSYSGCGSYLRGSLVSCQETDALAVWDRKTRKAYVAVDDHVVGGQHAKSPKLRLYPGREQWPPRAAAKLDAWMAGAVWNPEMSSRN